MPTYSIIGIDPGLVATGVARLDLDLKTGDILYIDLHTILLDNFAISDLDKQNNKRDSRLLGFKYWLRTYMETYNIAHVGYETPFYNMRRPNAFETLVEVSVIIRHAVIEHNPNIPISGISPAGVKKGIGIKGNSGKNDVENRIRELYPNLLFNSQHEMDALAVATCIHY